MSRMPLSSALVPSPQSPVILDAMRPIQRLASLGLRITGALAFLAPLLTRLIVGWGFHLTGHGKLQDLGKVTEFFGSLGIPFPHANAVFVSSSNFSAASVLIFGLGTRFFAFLLSCTLLVAVLTADRDMFVQKFPADPTDVTSFTFCCFWSGWFSMDLA